MQEATQEQAAKPQLFAVIELFGHARVAGAVSEQNFGGANLIRVDVPEVTYSAVDYDAPRGPDGYQKVTRTIPAHTRSFGAGAIYGVNWCDEETARLAAAEIRDEPLKVYCARKALVSLPVEGSTRLLPAGDGFDDEDRDDPPY